MNYLKIAHEDICNGSGLRCTIWVSGCSHYCKGCFNQEAANPSVGIPFDVSAKQEIFTELSKDYISGLTLSGGDPLYKDNVDEIFELMIQVKTLFPNKTIWLYSGYTWEQLFYDKTFHYQDVKTNRRRCAIIALADVFVDGEFKEGLKDVTLKWRGSKNQRVIDVGKSLHEDKIVLYCD